MVLREKGPDSVPIATFSIWRLIKDALLTDKIKVKEQFMDKEKSLEKIQEEQRKFHGVLRRSRKMGPVFVSILLTCVFLLVGKIFFSDFVGYVFCDFELVFFSFFYPYYSKIDLMTEKWVVVASVEVLIRFPLLPGEDPTARCVSNKNSQPSVYGPNPIPQKHRDQVKRKCTDQLMKNVDKKPKQMAGHDIQPPSQRPTEDKTQKKKCFGTVSPRALPEEEEKIKIKCKNCGAFGHRARSKMCPMKHWHRALPLQPLDSNKENLKTRKDQELQTPGMFETTEREEKERQTQEVLPRKTLLEKFPRSSPEKRMSYWKEPIESCPFVRVNHRDNDFCGLFTQFIAFQPEGCGYKQVSILEHADKSQQLPYQTDHSLTPDLKARFPPLLGGGYISGKTGVKLLLLLNISTVQLSFFQSRHPSSDSTQLLHGLALSQFVKAHLNPTSEDLKFLKTIAASCEICQKTDPNTKYRKKSLFIFSDTDRALLTQAPEDTKTHRLIISSRKDVFMANGDHVFFKVPLMCNSVLIADC
ncbi:hypothetical protein STEG23_008706, partial [Scotinomys teguina]